jgi:hypothetical protein
MLLHYLEVKQEMKNLIAQCELIGDTSSNLVKVASQSLVIAENELNKIIDAMRREPVMVGRNRIWLNERNNTYVVETFRYNNSDGIPCYGVLASFSDLSRAAACAKNPELFKDSEI